MRDFSFRKAIRIAKGSEDQPRDENGRWSSGSSSTSAAIDAVASGSAELLGHGDDGRVYAVGDKVVKVSSEIISAER